MANLDALGQQRAEFKENRSATATTLIVGLVSAGLGVILLNMFWFASRNETTFNRVLFAIGGLAALVGGVASVISFWQNRNGRVALHERGVLVERGGKQHIALWDEIVAVTEKVEKMSARGQHLYDRYLYTIEKRGGESFALSNMVSGVDSIGRTIKEETFARLYPQMLEAIERGEKVSFGAVRIDANGMESRGNGYLWTNLSGAKLANGFIEIKDRDGKPVMSGLYGATPNAHILLALLQKYLRLE